MVAKRTTKPRSNTHARARDGSLDNFVMFRVGFVLHDMRFKRLSDNAARVFMWLAASVISHRREILPPEVNVECIAWDLHKGDADVEAALDELRGGPRPLVGIMDDGRIRVIGQRKIAGNRFKWRDEPELDDNTAIVNDDTTIAQRSHNDSQRQPTISQEVDVEGEKEEETSRPDVQRSLHQYRALTNVTSSWTDSSGQTDDRVWVMQDERLMERTTDVIALALEIGDKSPPYLRPWAELRQRLQDGPAPQDRYTVSASKAIRAAEMVAIGGRAKGDPVQFRDVLEQ